MSALARWFKSEGKAVYGYDRSETAITKSLQNEGIQIHFADVVDLIPDKIRNDKNGSLIVFTPAIPKDHCQKVWFETNGFSLYKRSEILGKISSSYSCIAVAGTHGKTSVTSMIAHLLHHSGRNITAFVGGVMKNYNSNIIVGDSQRQDHWVIAEADEFDRSFLRLEPNLSVITSAEADHLDIYGKEETLKNSFRDFAKKLRVNGKLFVQTRFVHDFEDLDLNIKNYGIESGDCIAQNLRVIEDHFLFDYIDEFGKIENLELRIPGFHNVENATVAIAICREFNLSVNEISEGIKSYSGVSRRFDVIVRNDDIIYIDDYAHHPTEIEALLKSVRHLYPEKSITAIFQPHLYSRTRDFAEGFSKSLSLADKVILLPIYPARELPIDGVDSDLILKNINLNDKAIMNKEDAVIAVDNLIKGNVLLTIGAGDIDQLVPKIKAKLDV